MKKFKISIEDELGNLVMQENDVCTFMVDIAGNDGCLHAMAGTLQDLIKCIITAKDELDRTAIDLGLDLCMFGNKAVVFENDKILFSLDAASKNIENDFDILAKEIDMIEKGQCDERDKAQEG